MSETPQVPDSAAARAVPSRVERFPPGRDRLVLLLLLIWMSASVCAVRGVHASRGKGLLGTVPNGVDPNVAPWWELTILPEVGPGLARRIVAHREAHGSRPSGDSRAYAAPQDLDAVSGIGPTTVQRIAPFLRFSGHPSRRSPGSR